MRGPAGVFAVLLLLVAACGEDDPTFEVPEAPATTRPATPGAGDGGDCADVDPDAELDAVLDVRAQGPIKAGQSVTWVLELDYRGDAPVELRFGSGQDGDVVLLRGDDEVYRWSEGMLFTQAIRCRTVQPGGNVVFELGSGRLDVEPGDYTLRGTLASEPTPSPVEKTVTVEP